MHKSKKKRLEAAGWRVGDAAEFLDLSDEDVALIEVKLALAKLVRKLRGKRRWTQTYVAGLVDSSQSRVAKMEAADPGVSIDLLMRTVLAMGASRKIVGKVIGQATP